METFVFGAGSIQKVKLELDLVENHIQGESGSKKSDVGEVEPEFYLCRENRVEDQEFEVSATAL